MNKDLLMIYNLVYVNLVAKAPVLSRNLKYHINITNVQEHEITIEMDAKFYDVNRFMKTHEVVYTGPWKKDPTITGYAMWLNDKGAFASGNKSMHWVNRTLEEVCKAYVEKNGGHVDNRLPTN